MFKKPTKRQFLIRRIALSALATLSVIIIATVTILFMLGYRLDSGNGRLEQGALLQFDSMPSGADVQIDGKTIGRTATKQTVIAGTHTVKMVKYGYDDWSRTLTLTAGTLTWLDYTRFVPTDKTVEKVTTYKTLSSLKISPDNKWTLVQEKANQPVFQLIDLRSEEVKTNSLTLPESSYSEATTEGVKHTFTPTTWDSGGRYVLVKHAYTKNQLEWIVLDTQDPNNAKNVTTLFKTAFKDVQFASTSGKILYGLTNDGTIRTIDIASQTLSRALVSSAETFSVFDNTTVSYVGTDPSDAKKRVAGVYRDGDESPHVLRSVASTDVVLHIAVGRYFSNDYVAISQDGIVTVLKGKYPSSSSQDTSSLSQFAVFELEGDVSALSFSSKGDYVLAQANTNFKSYDIEHVRTAAGSVATADGKNASSLKWLDPAYLWNDDNGTLVMRDFDNSNVSSIMTVVSGYDAALSQNGRFFYAVGKNDDGYQFQRVRMIFD